MSQPQVLGKAQSLCRPVGDLCRCPTDGQLLHAVHHLLGEFPPLHLCWKLLYCVKLMQLPKAEPAPCTAVHQIMRLHCHSIPSERLMQQSVAVPVPWLQPLGLNPSNNSTWQHGLAKDSTGTACTADDFVSAAGVVYNTSRLWLPGCCCLAGVCGPLLEPAAPLGPADDCLQAGRSQEGRQAGPEARCAGGDIQVGDAIC
jgi:hypothetical protein